MAEWQNRPFEHASRNPTTSDHAHRSTGCARGVRSAARTAGSADVVLGSPQLQPALPCPGTPVPYYEEEIGMVEDPSPPGRFAVRTGMEWPAVREHQLDVGCG